jgi:hypothetical protein
MRLRTRLSILLQASLTLLAVGTFTTGGVAHAANNGVKIANYGTGKCLTVRNASRVSFTPIVQWICDDIPGQHWVFQGSPGGIRQVLNLDTGLCMEITAFQNGGAVVQASCGSGDAGLFWTITDLSAPFPQRKIILKSYTTNFCLDLENGGINDGLPLQVWQCNSNTNNQKWKVYAAST